MDANHALDRDPRHIKAILVKADALFAGGNFERGHTASALSRKTIIILSLSPLALVEFEKAARIYKTTEVTFGIEKCHQVQALVKTGRP